MIAGIGTDIVYLPRFRSLIAKRGAPIIARRILSPRELTEFKALIRGTLEQSPAAAAATAANATAHGSSPADAPKEVTSFRTILKGLNKNIENDPVTRFLANR